MRENSSSYFCGTAALGCQFVPPTMTHFKPKNWVCPSAQTKTRIVVTVCFAQYRIGFVLAKMIFAFFANWAEAQSARARLMQAMAMAFLRFYGLRLRQEDNGKGAARTFPCGCLWTLMGTKNSGLRLPPSPLATGGQVRLGA